MPAPLRAQAEALHRVMTDLVKRYQFRDRSEIVAYGLTVAQAYSLDALAARGTLAMAELAAELGVRPSAITRVVDELETKGLALRARDEADRRTWRIRATPRGLRVWRRLHEELVDVDEEILRSLSGPERELVVSVNRRLCAAIDAWRTKSRGRMG